MEQIKIFDPESNKLYCLEISLEDAHKIKNDTTFAQDLLTKLRDESQRKNIDAIQDDSSCQEEKICNWSYQASSAFIDAVKSRYEEIRDPRRRKCAWDNISTDMENMGYNHTAKQCAVKWKNLIRTYRSCKDSKSKSGKGPTRFMYFEMMDSFLNDKPSIKSEHSYNTEVETEICSIEECAPTTNTSEKYSGWSFEASSALIKVVKAHYEDMHHHLKRKGVWDLISTEMENLGYPCTMKQCTEKWKNLVRTYKTCKYAQTKSGRRPVRFMYYDMLDSFLGNESSNKNANSVNISMETSDFCVEEPTDRPETTSKDESDNELSKIPKRDALDDFIKLKKTEWKLRRKEKVKERESRQRRHEEKMKILREKMMLQREILEELRKKIK